MEKIELIEAVVICETENCLNGQIPIVVEMGVGGNVFCGVCSQQITNVKKEVAQ